MLTTLRILSTIAATFPLLASATPHIDAVFTGTFTTQMQQATGGLIETSTIDIPFNAEVRIEIDSPQYYNYVSANTTQTAFAGSQISTSLTPTVFAQHTISSSTRFSFSNSVYWFGDNPNGARNDFMSLAKGDELDYSKNEQWIYQLVIRTGVLIPSDIEQGPIDAHTLFTALNNSKETGKVFSVTEFYEIYPISGGPRTEANWYLGSASLTSISMVPEPSSALLFVIGVLALAVRRQIGANTAFERRQLTGGPVAARR